MISDLRIALRAIIPLKSTPPTLLRQWQCGQDSNLRLWLISKSTAFPLSVEYSEYKYIWR